MKILSLFDGISCARIAAERAGIKVDEYYASEIDKYAIQISKKNYPNTIRLGDVKSVLLPIKIDLLIGGSPCQDLSIAKRNRQGLKGNKSSLFYEYLRVLKDTKPKYFILENVASMKKEDRDVISKEIGVEPIMIDAKLVSAQNRKRLFWTNIKGIKQPKDRGIYLKDILEEGDTERLKSYAITATYSRANLQDYFYHGQRQLIFNKPVRVGKIGKGGQGDRIYSVDGKSVCLSANGGGRGPKTGLYEIKDYVRKLTPIECERLQGLEDNFTEGISNTQRYKCLGNAFNVDVVTHILKNIKN